MRADSAAASFAGSAAGAAAGSITHSPTRTELSRRIWPSHIIAVARAPHTLTDVRASGNVQENLTKDTSHGFPGGRRAAVAPAAVLLRLGQPGAGGAGDDGDLPRPDQRPGDG